VSGIGYDGRLPYASGQAIPHRAKHLAVKDGDPIAALASTFFAEMQPLIETPWSVAILDFAFPETRGQRPADFETTLKFGIALTRLAAEDPAVHKLTLEVQHLLKPRSVYRDPDLVRRVFKKMAEG